MNDYDLIIIGGGIVGLATAMAIAKRFDLKLAVLEAEGKLAAHQTGNNSGVIHSGLYYKPGSLKARNCVNGREKLYQFCRQYNIPHERCGKIVVATDQNEIEALNKLYERGLANGLNGLKQLSASELKEHEPHVTGIKGLYVPDTGIVDFIRTTETYADIVNSNNGKVFIHTKVSQIKNSDSELILETNQGDFHAKYLINCAGLQSDRITRMCGDDPKVKIIPFRGEYYQLNEDKKYLVKNLIYPVPDPRFPFLGVHFTRRVNGMIEAGPNAVLALKRYGYSKLSFSIKDSLETFSYAGFWRIARQFWLTGSAEYYRSFFKFAFVAALQKLVPELSSADIVPGGAGVRAQAVSIDGKLIDDFYMIETKNKIHVLNAPSPAATASLSIGETIAEMAGKNFMLKRK